MGNPYLPGGYKEYYIRDAQGNIMAMYKYTNSGPASLQVTERPLYGSKRLGSYAEAQQLLPATAVPANYAHPMLPAHTRYELADHLGNVRATVSGQLLPSANPASAFEPHLLSETAYEPFGSLLPGRNFSSDNYRWGFNGKENDNEVFGATGTFQNYGMRAYDTRVGRFISVDPLSAKYPFYTPYQFAGNKPIKNVDIDGLEELPDDIVRRGIEMGKAYIRQATEQLIIASVKAVVACAISEAEHRLDYTIKNSNDPEAISYALGTEFVLGIGKENRSFGPEDPFTKSLAKSDLTTAALKAYYKGYNEYKSGKRNDLPSQYRVDFKYLYPLDGGDAGPVIDGDMNAGEFVGTALYSFSLSKDEKTLSIHVYDTKNEYSFLLHLPGTDRHTRAEQKIMGETTQTYDFKISMKDVKKRTD